MRSSIVVPSSKSSDFVVSSSPKSLWTESYERLKKNYLAMGSAYFILFVILTAIFAPWISPFPFDEQHMDAITQSPNTTYWLGTDSLGRDLLSRIIYGARMSMAVAVITAMISLFIGGLYGAISGWIGGWVDSLMMRVVDMFYSIPTLVLMVLVKVVFDSVNLFEDPELKALTSILLALSAVGWVTLARIVRGQVLQVKEMPYVDAARSMGASSMSIMFRHVCPNILGPVIILLTMQIPGNILFESFLSFIGLGLQPPFSSWGVLASEGWLYLSTYPHLTIAPGVYMFITMLAFNFLGDGLRDAFDPQMRGRM